jgi:hypothetical protein
MPGVVKSQNNQENKTSIISLSFFRTSYRNLQHNIAIKYSFSAMAWQIVDISPTLTHLSESKLGEDQGAGIRALV